MLLFVVFTVRSMRRGHRIGAATVVFCQGYEELIRDGVPKADALRDCFSYLKRTYPFTDLRMQDLEWLTDSLVELDSPHKLVEKMIIDNDSKQALAMLKDQEFMKGFVATARKMELAGVEIAPKRRS
jgi:hypothetical protein